jgi:flagellar protein FliS
MVAINYNARYREQQITTASRGQLLLMVYDGILRALTEGKRAMQERRLEDQNRALKQAEDLLLELMITINYDSFPQLATNLERLYRYLYQQLVQANVHDDVQAVNDVTKLVQELRDTWAEADLLCRQQGQVRVGAGV